MEEVKVWLGAAINFNGYTNLEVITVQFLNKLVTAVWGGFYGILHHRPSRWLI